MRKENAGFRTAFLSEEGSKLLNKDYFAYVELENFACYVAADSLDEEKSTSSAETAVKSILRSFMEHPTLSAALLRRYLKRAHRELLANREGLRLRASIALVATDYVKFRFAWAGNSRAALVRNGRILYRSKDQSLSENLVEDERIPKDRAAAHEERNNLYSYLGQLGRRPEWQVSGKKKLGNGDTVLLYTRGVWENCSEGELLACAKEVGEPQELADNVEECILGKLKEEIENYTIAATFVDKVYLNPKKRWSLKKTLAVAIPLLVVLAALGIGLFIRHRIRVGKEEEMAQHIEKGADYVSYHNFEKAAEEYEAAEELARSLKDKGEEGKIAACLMLLEQILLADQAMAEADYEKAGELYAQAKELSGQAQGMGLDYLTGQEEKVDSYRDLFELLDAGEYKEGYGNYAGAIDLYRQAKEKASALKDKEARNEALEKQQAAEEALEKQQEEELAALEEQIQAAIVEEQAARELEEQDRINDRKNAMELESKGNELMKNEDYLSAITYFETAMGMYEDLEMPGRGEALAAQIEACRKLHEAAQKKAAEEAAAASAEEAAAQEAREAAEEARKAAQELKEAEADKVLEEAKQAAEEAKQAAEEAKNNSNGQNTSGISQQITEKQ